ncbi:ABC transporter permease [Lactococcus hodotermopsidis]|uniref:ABC transporter permease n=1 Tax=Pseudolactococcus hodotermopsidis TaxID=2709157 RepID=A0A6A0BC41_9LACT|nr:ABC transporter permease [Lactococcus hodotermopsidis]GFH41964.1 ABC transporter permease [Lactococcus hodotermopsidis]
MFYLKLAYQNIRKSLATFAPFLLAATVMFAMTLILSTIAFSSSVDELKGAEYVRFLLLLGLAIIVFFAIIIVSYSYRFLLKQRTKEFGLYNILGLNKRNIATISFWELVLSFLATLLVGTILGVIFSQFLYLIFVNLIGSDYFALKLSLKAILLTIVVFALIFGLLMLFAFLTIRRNSAISLLQDNGRGEREPRGRLVISILSLAMIGIAYYLALSVKSPIEALMKFAIAVVLVIIGTYLLYLGVTIFILKRQKANKAYYYKPEHFITTSSMLYRMKTNAVGLANITILVTMTFVMLATSVTLYVGTEKVIKDQFPQNSNITVFGSNIAENEQILIDFVEKNDIKTSKIKSYSTFMALEVFNVNQTKEAKFPSKTKGGSDFAEISFVTRDDMVKIGNDLPEIQANQVLICNQTGKRDVKTIDWYGEKLEVTKTVMLNNFPLFLATYDTFVLVVKDEEVLLKLNSLYSNLYTTFETRTFMTLSDDEQATLMAVNTTNGNLHVSTEKDSMTATLSFTGGFLFIGFILGMTFILGAALIIYYKQISEGAEDKRSYRILQEVGLTKKEVKKSINSQILIVFFMPIVVSVIHFSAAFVMISKLIKLFSITDMTMIASVSIITILIISAIYYLIYRKTSRVYYQIVER